MKEDGTMDEEGLLLNPNEPVIFRTNSHQDGARIEIYERIQK